MLEQVQICISGCVYNVLQVIYYVNYAAPIEEEEAGAAYPGVIPVGRGLSTMTRPTT